MLPSYDVTLKTLYVAQSKGIKSLDGNGPMAFWISISNFDKNLQVFAPNCLDTLQEQTKCIYVKWHVYSAGPLLSSPFSGGLPPGHRQDFIVKYAIILIRQHDSDPASYVRNLQTSAWCYSWSECKQKHHFCFLFCQLSNTFWPSGFGWKLYLFKGPPKPPALPFNLLGLQDDPERPRGGKENWLWTAFNLRENGAMWCAGHRHQRHSKNWAGSFSRLKMERDVQLSGGGKSINIL